MFYFRFRRNVYFYLTFRTPLEAIHVFSQGYF